MFVPLTLPGERARVRIRTRNADTPPRKWRRLIATAPQRVVPECRHFGTCGGCQYQHAAYETQLDLKQAVLRETLERGGVPAPAEIDVLARQATGVIAIAFASRSTATAIPDTVAGARSKWFPSASARSRRRCWYVRRSRAAEIATPLLPPCGPWKSRCSATRTRRRCCSSCLHAGAQNFGSMTCSGACGSEFLNLRELSLSWKRRWRGRIAGRRARSRDGAQGHLAYPCGRRSIIA